MVASPSRMVEARGLIWFVLGGAIRCGAMQGISVGSVGVDRDGRWNFQIFLF